MSSVTWTRIYQITEPQSVRRHQKNESTNVLDPPENDARDKFIQHVEATDAPPSLLRKERAKARRHTVSQIYTVESCSKECQPPYHSILFRPPAASHPPVNGWGLRKRSEWKHCSIGSPQHTHLKLDTPFFIQFHSLGEKRSSNCRFSKVGKFVSDLFNV